MGLKILNIFKKIARYTSASTLMLAGILGVGIVSYNPLNYLAPYLPI